MRLTSQADSKLNSTSLVVSNQDTVHEKIKMGQSSSFCEVKKMHESEIDG